MASAGRRISTILHNRGYNVTPYPVNKGRHIILKAEVPRSGKIEVYYCLFKRALFHTYNIQFQDTWGEGFGETLNLNYYQAIRKSKMLTHLLFCYPNGHIYEVEPQTLHDYFDKHYRVRMQNETSEITISFPIQLTDRWDSSWTSEDLNYYINKPGLSDKIKLAFRRLKEKLFPSKPDVLNHI